MSEIGNIAGQKVRVLIVDDSALMRRLLGQILSGDPEIEVVGAASDPIVAQQKIKVQNPDVITLDIEMPRINGLEFLERLMRERPLPVVMVSALTQKGADATLQALEMGAVDFIGKPMVDAEQGWTRIKDEMIAKVKAAARATPRARRPVPATPVAMLETDRGLTRSNKIVTIGASTGGVMALQEILVSLPADCPPILIAQHMPASFTGRFAERLNGLTALSVSEALHNAQVLPGHAYIAPGDKHLTLSRAGAQLQCALKKGSPGEVHCPSVDELFKSAAAVAGPDGIGVLLTGMGKDGAQGLRDMRRAGAVTICQDEASSLIYGMPQAAMALGAAERELPLGQIAAFLLERAARVTKENTAVGDGRNWSSQGMTDGSPA